MLWQLWNVFCQTCLRSKEYSFGQEERQFQSHWAAKNRTAECHVVKKNQMQNAPFSRSFFVFFFHGCTNHMLESVRVYVVLKKTNMKNSTKIESAWPSKHIIWFSRFCKCSILQSCEWLPAVQTSTKPSGKTSCSHVLLRSNSVGSTNSCVLLLCPKCETMWFSSPSYRSSSSL